MKKIMKKALSLLLVLALAIVPMTVMAADGSYADPHQLSASSVRFYVYVQPGETQYVQVDNCDGTTVEVGYATSGTYQLIYGRQTIFPNQDVDNTATLAMQTYSDIFGVYNAGEEAVSVYMSLTAGQLAGTMDNPEQVTLADPYESGMLMAELETSLAAGNQGYYYTLTAPADGAILTSVNAYDDEWNPVGWMFNVNNITSGKYGDYINSDDYDGNEEVCPVSSGDKVDVFVTTFDSSNPWNSPAGKIYVSFRFVTKGNASYPDTINLGDNSAAIIDSAEYCYAWTATEDGNATVTITSASEWGYMVRVTPVDEEDYGAYYNGDYHMNVDDPVVSSETVPMYAGETIYVTINIPYDYDTWQGKSGTVNWTFAFEAGEVDKGNSGDQGGDLGGDENNYEFSNTVLQLGDNPVTLSTYEWTLFEFTPDETGEYLFQTDDGVIGYWGAGTFFVQEPDESTLEGNLREQVTSVGQSIIVGITSVYGANTCNIAISRVGDAENDSEYDEIEYENVVTPEEFTFPGNAETLLDSYVDTEDSVADTAVLGDDGYYHLNSANGPVLFANLSDEILSLVDAQSFGQLSAVNYENGVAVSITDFYNAFDKYVACADTDSVEGATLYPLTEDLITIFQLVGNDKGWYGEYGYLGGTEEDAWMFACYYDEAITSLAPATDEEGGTTGGATTDSTTSNNNTSSSTIQTGDNTNAFVWVAVMMVGLAAVVVALKKRAR